jgi:hypothetical protein
MDSITNKSDNNERQLFVDLKELINKLNTSDVFSLQNNSDSEISTLNTLVNLRNNVFLKQITKGGCYIKKKSKRKTNRKSKRKTNRKLHKSSS